MFSIALNDVDNATLARMLRLGLHRQQSNENGRLASITGFTLELSEGTASAREVVDECSEALNADPISHVLKCEDPLLRSELALRGDELFNLEMKLRRVLSIIYLHAYSAADPYDLLAEETMQPMAKERPQREQMKAVGENQFFHLTFGQYVSLNQRPAIKDLVSLIRHEETYEAFRAELLRQPVQHEDDASFLAGLRERMDAIEKMRNAVAHNRRPSRKTTNDYLNALPLVDRALDDYLSALAADLLTPEDEDDWAFWEVAARKAVEHALSSAEWDKATQTITLHDPDEPRIWKTVSSSEELFSHLESVASAAFYASCPREDGDFLYECDEYGTVEEAIGPYEERLNAFFSPAEEP